MCHRWVTVLHMDARQRSIWSDQLAATIRAERSAAGLTQSEMVTRTGIARSTYVRMEKGERVADITQIGLICQALKLPLSTFMRRVEERVTQVDDAVID